MTKRSIIWKVPDDVFENIVSESVSISEVLSKLGLQNRGGNYKTLKNRIDENGIDITHIMENTSKFSNKYPKKSVSLSEVLVKDSTYNRCHLKRRLIEENLLENKCSACPVGDTWNGQPISLHLDHIDGVSTNNELSNLRLLCPNCHSQTDTYAGKKNVKEKHKCIDCNSEISRGAKNQRCQPCQSKLNRRVERPSKDILEKQIEEYGYVGTGKIYGVSDNAIRKWIKAS